VKKVKPYAGVVELRVARWYFFIQKAQFGCILEGLGMENLGIFYVHSEYLRPFGIFLRVWNISWSIGIFFIVLVCCIKKNLATLVELNVKD
jgi:hypothetical protein